MDADTEPKVAKFTTPGRHKQWIAPLRQMTPRDMPHDLFCFATRYLVEDARTLAVPDATLTQDLPDWLTIDHLLDTGKQVSHGVFVALAERLKEARDDPSPERLRTAAYHAAGFEDWVTNMVRRGGSVRFAMGFTSFMGNLVTKDQHVDAGERKRIKGTIMGRTVHYFLRPESDMYYEQTTFTKGYYEILTRLWKMTANAPLITVNEIITRFSPEHLLKDEYAYAARALGIEKIERDSDGNLRINSEVYAVPVDANTIGRFNPKYASKNARPVQMTRPVEYAGEVIFPEGHILDAPASVYFWEYKKLPPVTGLQIFVQGFKDRFVSTKHLRESYDRVSQERDRAEANLEEANRQRAEAERQRGIAEDRATALQQLITGMAHEYRNLLGRVQLRARGLELYLSDTGAPEEHREAAHLAALETLIALETSEGLRALTVAQPPVELTDLGKVVNDVATVFLNDPKYRNVEVTFNGEGTYEAEIIKGTAYSLVANLMTNAARAMKYGAEGRTKMDITLTSETRYGVRGITLSVKDEGCGMEKEKQERYKAGKLPPGSEESSGTGHKLITDIARAHNKNHHEQGLDLESEVGQGTRVQVFIPEHYQR